MKARFLLVFASLLVTCKLLSQITFNKQHHFGWPLAIGNSLYVTDSCYYFSGLIVDTIAPYRSGLIFGKLDEYGDTISTKAIFDENRTFENWLTPLHYSNDGYFISMGYGVDSIDRYNYWMKLTESGEVIGYNQFRNVYFPLENGTRVNDFIQDDNNNYYILVESFINENDLELTPGYNASLVKFNEWGDSLYTRTYEEAYELFPNVIQKKGDTLILGMQRSNRNLTSSNLKYYSKIRAVDTLGDNLWSWQSSHSVEQGVNDMLVSEDGGLVVVSGRGYLHPINPYDNTIYWDRGLVFKLNQEQEVEWECELRVPYPGVNELNNLIKAVDGSGYVVAGKQTDLYGEDPGGAVMGWLAKVSETGDSLWSRKLFYYELPDSLEYWHQIHDLQSTPDGGYIMSGQTLDRNQLSFPIQQAWYIKVDAEGCLIPNCGLVDSKEVSEIEGAPLLLYPNPAKDYLNVYMGDNGGEDWYFHIVNAQGQEVGQYIAPTAHTTYMIAIEHLPAVAYYLQLKDKDGRLMKTYPWVKVE